MKACSKCGGARERTTGGLLLKCRQCHARRERERKAKNPEEEKERQRAYRVKNLERKREWQKAYYAKNIDRMHKLRRVLRAKNAVKIKEANRVWYAKNKARQNEKSRAYYANNAERMKWLVRIDRWKKHGITITWDQYERMEAMQDFCCANPGCRINLGKGELVPDHDHAFGDAIFGNVRGLLCSACNTAGGLLRDSPLRMRGLATYHEKHPPRLGDPTPRKR